MGEQGWQCIIDGEEHGPLTDAELRLLARDGNLKPDDLVRREGMQDWIPAKRLKGLFGESAKKPEQPKTCNPIADSLAQLASQQAKTSQQTIGGQQAALDQPGAAKRPCCTGAIASSWLGLTGFLKSFFAGMTRTRVFLIIMVCWTVLMCMISGCMVISGELSSTPESHRQEMIAHSYVTGNYWAWKEGQQAGTTMLLGLTCCCVWPAFAFPLAIAAVAFWKRDKK